MIDAEIKVLDAYGSNPDAGDAVGEGANVIDVGREHDSAANGRRGGDDDSVDRWRHASHPGAALKPGCRTSDRIGAGDNLELLQHLICPGITSVAKQSFGEHRCRYENGNARLVRRRQDRLRIFAVVPCNSP